MKHRENYFKTCLKIMFQYQRELKKRRFFVKQVSWVIELIQNLGYFIMNICRIICIIERAFVISQFKTIIKCLSNYVNKIIINHLIIEFYKFLKEKLNKLTRLNDESIIISRNSVFVLEKKSNFDIY